MSQPKFPLYIISKGRYDSMITSKVLCKMKIKHHIVVEEQEFLLYKKASNEEFVTLLILDKQFQKDYDPCMALKDGEGVGSGAARNFAWEHSIKAGYDFHWIMDDNIRNFYYFNKNVYNELGNGKGFKLIEEYIQCFDNMAMAGPEYYMFIVRREKKKPVTLNTRLFSCILIRNKIKQRWRGRYNEDICLSLDVLKAGWCTAKFYCSLQEKMTTQTVKGGNNTEIYKDGTDRKSKMIVALHPDCCVLAMRYGRQHHHCHYNHGKLRLTKPVRNKYIPEKITITTSAKVKKK